MVAHLLVEKVLRKLDFTLSKEEIDAIVKCKPGAIEYTLKNFQVKITQIQQRKLQEDKQKMEESEFEASGEVVLPASPPPQILQIHPAQKKTTPAAVFPTIQDDILAEKDSKIKELTETVKVCCLPKYHKTPSCWKPKSTNSIYCLGSRKVRFMP